MYTTPSSFLFPEESGPRHKDRKSYKHIAVLLPEPLEINLGIISFPTFQAYASSAGTLTNAHFLDVKADSRS